MSRLSSKSPEDERRAAWSGAKLAVRSYARDPTARNAGRVRSAWRRVRTAMTRAVDQRIELELAELKRRNPDH